MHPTLLLARTFFRRFFESDLMPVGPPQVQLVIWSMALLASPGLLLPGRFAYKYKTLEHSPVALAQALVTDRLLFITLTMAALGLVALVVWDGVFPDRRDACILGSLPLRHRELIAARLAALAALAGIFCLGITIVPTVLYGPLVASFGAASNGPRGAVAHLLATSLAGCFVFFGLIALQGVMLNVVGRRIAERVAMLLEVLFAIVLLQLLFFMPQMASRVGPDLRAASGGWLGMIPSLWFVGLYDVLGGAPGAGSPALAARAILGTATVAGASVVLFAATHARLTRLALESRERATAKRLGPLAVRIAARVLPWRPVERATAGFTLRTLLRSRRHGMLLALHLGVGLALVVSAAIPMLLRSGVSAFNEPGILTLSAPLVVLFFVLVGLRYVFALPIEPRANWVWRLHEPADRAAAVDGACRAMILAAVLPISALAAIAAFALWGARVATLHGVVCFAMGALLANLLCLALVKVPFTCTYFPGRSRVHTLWPLYLSGFITFAYTTASIERNLLDRPRALLGLAAITAIAGAALVVLRARLLDQAPGLRFEEEDPQAIFEGFGLSEGTAEKLRG